MYDGEAIGRMRKLHGIQDGGANISTFSSDGLMRLMRQTADRDENVTLGNYYQHKLFHLYVF